MVQNLVRGEIIRVPDHVPIFSVHTGVFGAAVPNNLTAYNSAYRKFWLWIAVFRYTLLYTTRNTGTYWFAYHFQKGEPLLSRRIGLVKRDIAVLIIEKKLAAAAQPGVSDASWAPPSYVAVIGVKLEN